MKEKESINIEESQLRAYESIDKDNNSYQKDDWISVNDAMPGLNSRVELKFDDGTFSGKYRECIFKYSANDIIGFVFTEKNNNFFINYRVTHWRKIPEKRPDFSKLKEGDFIILHLESLKRVGFFNGLDKDGDIRMGSYNDLSTYNYTQQRVIKKITRINLEEKTFEEI